MEKVLFICTANVCRSPMAAAIFNALAEDRGLAVRAESAGVAALERGSMASNAVVALGEIGVAPPPHRARQISRSMLENTDLVLAMTPEHVEVLRRSAADFADRIHTLPGYATGAPDLEGVPDPYGNTVLSYRATVRQLVNYIELLLDRLGEKAPGRQPR